jgi:hypothetical protein
MQIFRNVFQWLFPMVAALALPCVSSAETQPDGVVAHYHFLGTSHLPQTASFAPANKVFALGSSRQFVDLVDARLSMILAQSAQWPVNAATIRAFHSLLGDAAAAESVGSFGGAPGHPLNFVLAFRLDEQRAQAWQQALETASRRKGDVLRDETYTGWVWNKGATNSFWIIRAGDWLVVGRGDDLAGARTDYLRQIQKSGDPAPALQNEWFHADVDWPRFSQWFPLSSCPFKLGRTEISLSAQGQDLFLNGRITYPEAISWHAQPWRVPTTLVREPLVAFSTGQDVEAFLKSDETASRLGATLFSDQFYFWAMGEMPFESYLAWPVQDTTNAVRALSPKAIQMLNPTLKKVDGTELTSSPAQTALYWKKLQLIVPELHPAPASAGQFLVAGIFALTPGKKAAPAGLWQQFQTRNDLVYYDWELTGPRLQQLRTLTEVLPILQMAGLPAPARTFPSDEATRLSIKEHWLAGLTPLLGNTVTRITKTGPRELTVVRKAPFVFTSLELVLLSHWLSDTPAGPLNWSLLPQAKMTGPGLPH